MKIDREFSRLLEINSQWAKIFIFLKRRAKNGGSF
jgi:hypothetical protein